MNRKRLPSSAPRTTAQRRLERLGTVLVVLARAVGVAALLVGILQARRKAPA